MAGYDVYRLRRRTAKRGEGIRVVIEVRVVEKKRGRGTLGSWTEAWRKWLYAPEEAKLHTEAPKLQLRHAFRAIELRAPLPYHGTQGSNINNSQSNRHK
jgi:hypothetical protein